MPIFFYLFDPAIAIGWFFGLMSGAILFTWLYNSTDGSLLAVALWHGAFNFITASAAGVGIFWQFAVSSNHRERWARFAFFILVIGISGLFGLAENHILMLDKGIIQRILYLVGLAWLVYEERFLISERNISK